MADYSFEYPTDPDNGKSVEELITELLQSGEEATETSAIWLLERIFQIEENHAIYGKCLEKSRSIQYWKLDDGPYKLVYSFEPGIKKFRYLTLLNGSSDEVALNRAKKIRASC